MDFVGKVSMGKKKVNYKSALVNRLRTLRRSYECGYSRLVRGDFLCALFFEPLVEFGTSVGGFPGVVADMFQGCEPNIAAAGFFDCFNHSAG